MKEIQTYSLGDIANISSGSTPLRAKHDEFYSNGTHPWVKTTDLNNGNISATEECITELAAKKCKPYPKGTVLIAMYGGFNQIGRTGLLLTACSINQALAALSIDNKIARPEYVLQYLNHNVKQWRRYAASSRKDPNITSSDVRDFTIELPPLPEQKKIADLLSTWDEAIDKTENLITAKQKAFVVHLDNSVFKSRNSNWTEVRLGKAFRERVENQRDDLPLLSISREDGITPREDTNRKDTSNEDKSKYLRICPGDIGYNTMRMWQGVSALSDLEGIVSPAYTICIPERDVIDGKFAAYLFKHKWVIHQFYKHSQGLTSDTWNLKFPHFSKIKVWLPTIENQRLTVVKLDLLQKEISLLKALLEKQREQKRGLMQKLLTGEWRVKVA